jgi:hypothetical protein
MALLLKSAPDTGAFIDGICTSVRRVCPSSAKAARFRCGAEALC